jgi:hypothetical protein
VADDVVEDDGDDDNASRGRKALLLVMVVVVAVSLRGRLQNPFVVVPFLCAVNAYACNTKKVNPHNMISATVVMPDARAGLPTRILDVGIVIV